MNVKFSYCLNTFISNQLTIRLVVENQILNHSLGEIIYFTKNKNNKWLSEFSSFDKELINYLVEYGYINIPYERITINNNIYCYLILAPKALLELI